MKNTLTTNFIILHGLKNTQEKLVKFSQNVTGKLQYEILKNTKPTKTKMKPPKLTDTSCKEHTNPSCIISTYIKIWNYFIPQVFSPSSFSFLAKKRWRSTNQRKCRKLISVTRTKYFAKIISIEESIPLSRSEFYFLCMPTAITILLLINKHLVLRPTF